jgi:hypothetical protein
LTAGWLDRGLGQSVQEPLLALECFLLAHIPVQQLSLLLQLTSAEIRDTVIWRQHSAKLIYLHRPCPPSRECDSRDRPVRSGRGHRSAALLRPRPAHRSPQNATRVRRQSRSFRPQGNAGAAEGLRRLLFDRFVGQRQRSVRQCRPYVGRGQARIGVQEVGFCCPLAPNLRRMSSTGILVPRITGLPSITAGLISMRSARIVDMLLSTPSPPLPGTCHHAHSSTSSVACQTCFLQPVLTNRSTSEDRRLIVSPSTPAAPPPRSMPAQCSSAE